MYTKLHERSNGLDCKIATTDDEACTPTHDLSRCMTEDASQPVHDITSRVLCFWPEGVPFDNGQIQMKCIAKDLESQRAEEHVERMNMTRHLEFGTLKCRNFPHPR